MSNHALRRSSRGVSIITILAVFVLVLVVASIALTYNRWEGQPPQVTYDREFESLGRTFPLSLTVADTGAGLKQVTVRLKQGEQEVALIDELFDRPGAGESRTYDLGMLIPAHYQIQEGPASLIVTASDYSFRGFLGGNTVEATKDFRFDIYPPRLEVLSGQHYINQGGAECVVYRVSDDATISGVQVGPHFFPGYPADPSDPEVHFALFGYAYNLPADTAVTVVARDGAGNESIAGIWQRVFPKAFRSRQIVLDDNFLRKVVPEIVSRTPSVQDQGDLVKTYVEINSKLRTQNHDTIRELSMQSEGRFLWNGAFLQLSNSQVESLFADRRTYTYQGQAVDQQDHVGFDLSVVERYPIEAANDGKVILADYFGIYGNTVLIDHGTGLISLYGHMSSIDVQPGQMVQKRQVLGRSGATGLAGGDHLHFGLFLHGVPVNPTEWWDPKWIQEHVLDRLKAPPAAAGATNSGG